MDAVEKKQDERCASGDWSEIMELQNPHPTTELVAYHKVKRKFLSLADIQNEDPNQLVMYEFRGEDFVLVAD